MNTARASYDSPSYMTTLARSRDLAAQENRDDEGAR
jgi:hypothetical protein